MRVSLKLPPGEVARAGLVMMGLAVGAYLLWRVQEVLFLLFVAILLATAIEPLVNRLRRGPFTRGSGTLVVYSVIILVIGAPIYAVVPGLAGQAASFAESGTQRLQQLREQASVLPRPVQGFAVETVESALNALQSPAPPGQTELVEAGATAAHTILSFLTVFVLAFYWLL